MKSPLLVVGAARSGTTLVAERLLGGHPDVLYWSEPAFVWRYGNAYRFHDMFCVDHCRPGIRRRIRSAFERKESERPHELLVEKSPANSYRMPFVLSVLPEARILHVVRDGRQVARSARAEWAGRGRTAYDSAAMRRLSSSRRIVAMIQRDLRWHERFIGPASPFELPAYLPRALGLLLRQTLHVSWFPWGPRFPGILRARRQLGALEVAALQWHLSVTLTKSACAHLGGTRYHEVAFERLQVAPRETLEEIREYAGLAPCEEWSRTSLALLKPRPVEASDGLSNDEIVRIEEMFGLTLEGLGYTLLSPSAEKG